MIQRELFLTKKELNIGYLLVPNQHKESKIFWLKKKLAEKPVITKQTKQDKPRKKNIRKAKNKRRKT